MEIGGGMEDQDALRQKIVELEVEHRDLDEVLTGINQNGSFDQIQVQRLKKRKLILKDEITRLRNRLVPDIIA